MIETINKILNKFVGNKSQRDLRDLEPLVEKIHEVYPTIEALSHDGLRAKTTELKERIRDHVREHQDQVDALKAQAREMSDEQNEEKEKLYEEVDRLEKEITKGMEEVLEEILPEAFAVVKQTAYRFTNNEQVEVTATEMDRDLAADRDSIEIQGDKAIWYNSWLAAGNEITWDMVHYDVQLIGGIVLHQGKIAEMATGEGKTLVATLPVYLNALTGRGVHLVTVNNYLAKRDSEWMGPIFEFHGLKVDCIDNHQPNSDDRRKAYQADITYGTNNEFGFDYLRDNMSGRPEELVQRKHNFAIVDEVDSVLVDDARTPLIISGPTPRGDQHEFVPLKPKVERLFQAQRNYVNQALAESKKLLAATPEDTPNKKELDEKTKRAGLLLLRAHRGLPKNKALIKYLSEPGVRTHLQRTENYYLQDQEKEMHKVDEELFFVIQEKQNSVELTEKGLDLITGASEDPNLFVLPDIGWEVNQLEKSDLPTEEKLKQKDKLISDYSDKAQRVHTINQLLKSYTLFEKDVDYVLMDNKVKIVDEQTGRIMEGRRYSDGLHQAIEAKENVKIEAATQTYATVTLQNYFRMYNKLAGMTGTAETEAGEFWEIYKLDVVVIPTNRPIARNDEEDLVYKTVREKYNAVIDEVVSLTEKGRPVLVGTTSVEVSELLSRMLKLRKIRHNVLNAKLHQREAEVVAEAGQPGAVTIATNMAGRGTDIKLGPGVREAGGLAIIGTERHESRRIDRQLRGRAGRQGDTGSSQFYVSLEDNLMRLFGSERIARLMDRMGLEEGEVIQHRMISRSIERAQKKVEENNFGVRKRLLEYDDVMNHQREVIYKKRRYALFGDRIGVETAGTIRNVCDDVVQEYQEHRDFEGFQMELIKTFGMDSPFPESDFISLDAASLTDKLYEEVYDQYRRKSDAVSQIAFPVIKNVYENESGAFKFIDVPFTDGRKALKAVADLEEAYQTEGRILTRALEKSATLGMIDLSWKEHLREMDDLRQSVQGAVYEQKDPLLIYKFESFKLFEQMLGKVNREIASFTLRANIMTGDQGEITRAQQQTRRGNQDQVKAGRGDALVGAAAGGGAPANQGAGAPQEAARPQPVRTEKKVGRNDPCPCGSGKKYKHCHAKGG